MLIEKSLFDARILASFAHNALFLRVANETPNGREVQAAIRALHILIRRRGRRSGGGGCGHAPVDVCISRQFSRLNEFDDDFETE